MSEYYLLSYCPSQWQCSDDQKWLTSRRERLGFSALTLSVTKPKPNPKINIGEATRKKINKLSCKKIEIRKILSRSNSSQFSIYLSQRSSGAFSISLQTLPVWSKLSRFWGIFQSGWVMGNPWEILVHYIQVWHEILSIFIISEALMTVEALWSHPFGSKF